MKLKTTKDFKRDVDWLMYGYSDIMATRKEQLALVEGCFRGFNILREEAINWIKNLQSAETEYPTILTNFPDSMKGSIAKDRWNDTNFRYGAEYGMLAFIIYFFNIKEEDLE